MRRKLLEFLNPAGEVSGLRRYFAIGMMSLIFLNVVAVTLETSTTINADLGEWLWKFEVFSVIIFSIEYLLRLYSCTADSRYSHSVLGRIRYALTPLMLIDLAAVLPFFVPFLIPADLRFLRGLRLFRVFRLFKLGRYSEAVAAMGQVFRQKRGEITISIFSVLILLIIASSLMYYIENPYQPEAFSSIPAAMWWGIATLTTVGYGDVYPITTLGRICGAALALLGIGLFALPAGIFASGFSELISKDRSSKICPHCGRDIDQD